MSKREPSIHITESKLTEIISRLIEKPTKSKKGWEAKLAKEITRLAKKENLNARTILVSSEMVDKRVKKQLRAKTSDTHLLAELLYLIRYKRGHRGISKIKEGTAEYTKLKGLVEVCVQFCNEFGLTKKKGFTIYLQLGLQRINSTMNYITKLVNMSESISQIYQAEEEIRQDTNKTETENIIKYYSTKILSSTGMAPLIDKDVRKKAIFVKVREITDELDIPHHIYIDAQFKGLEWTDSYPEPHQLIGDSAIERVNKYMFEKKIRVDKKDNPTTNIKDKLKKLKR